MTLRLTDISWICRSYLSVMNFTNISQISSNLYFHQETCVPLLLASEDGRNVLDSIDRFGSSPIHYAVQLNNMDITQLLLDKVIVIFVLSHLVLMINSITISTSTMMICKHCPIGKLAAFYVPLKISRFKEKLTSKLSNNSFCKEMTKYNIIQYRYLAHKTLKL